MVRSLTRSPKLPTVQMRTSSPFADALCSHRSPHQSTLFPDSPFIAPLNGTVGPRPTRAQPRQISLAQVDAHTRPGSVPPWLHSPSPSKHILLPLLPSRQASGHL